MHINTLLHIISATLIQHVAYYSSLSIAYPIQHKLCMQLVVQSEDEESKFNYAYILTVLSILRDW